MSTVVQTDTETGLLGRLLAKNPLALGILAMFLGTLVGLLIPETERENALLGPKRDQLAQQAQETVQEYAQKAGAVAGAAQEAAKEALHKAEDATKEAISDALETVKEEAQHQGLPVGG